VKFSGFFEFFESSPFGSAVFPRVMRFFGLSFCRPPFGCSDWRSISCRFPFPFSLDDITGVFAQQFSIFPRLGFRLGSWVLGREAKGDDSVRFHSWLPDKLKLLAAKNTFAWPRSTCTYVHYSTISVAHFLEKISSFFGAALQGTVRQGVRERGNIFL
jgi:hypothetical protein